MSSSSNRPHAVTSPVAPESRYLSVLFCDLADSTALTRKIGPEQMFALIRDFQDRCRTIIESHDGYVARFMGDGLVAYFGYPRAIENSAAISLRAAQDLLQQIPSADSNAPVAIRIGLDCGWNVVGELHHGRPGQEVTVIGNTPNVAARLQSAARINEILASNRIARQAHGLFRFGRPRLVQLSEDLDAVTARRLTSRAQDMTQSRLAAENHDTRHYGHRKELRQLASLKQNLQTNTASFVEVTGEGGIGKTRLLDTFRQHLDADTLTIDLYCAQHQSSNPLWPLRSWLARTYVMKEDSFNPAFRKQEIAGFLRGLAPDILESEVELLTTLSQSRGQDAPLPLQGDALIEAVARILTKLASARSLVLIVEDLHWADPSTRNLLSLLKDKAQDLSLLNVLSYRPNTLEQTHFWEDSIHVVLPPLDQKACLQLLDDIDVDERLSTEQRTTILSRSGGNPLYLREITRAALETLDQSVNPAETPAIPDTLAEALVTRLGTHPETRPTVEAAAIINRSFSPLLVARILNRPVEEIELHIGKLQSAGLLDYVRDTADQVRYQFSHALLKDAALQLMLDWQRRKLHEATLQAYLLLRPDIEVKHPEDIAPHYLGAGRCIAGVRLLKTAATRCVFKGQFFEAAVHLDLALAALAREDEGADLIALELDLQTEKGKALIQKLGFGAPEVKTAFSRAWHLCSRLNRLGPPEYQSLWGLWANRVVSGYDETANAMFTRLGSIAASHDSRELNMQTASAGTIDSFCQGDITGIMANHTTVAALYDFDQDRTNALTYSQDPLLLAQLFAAHSAWIAGQQSRSDACYQAALSHVAQLELPFLAPYTQVFGAAPRCYLAGMDGHGPNQADLQADAAHFQACMALAEDEKQPFWQVNALAWLATNRAAAQSWHEAQALFEQSLGLIAAMGQTFFSPYFRAQQALCLLNTGQGETALAMITQDHTALRDHPQDRALIPEIWRLHAVIYNQAGSHHRATAKHLLHRAEQLAEQGGMWAWWLKIKATQHQHCPQDAGMTLAEALIHFDAVAEADHAVARALRAKSPSQKSSSA